MDGNKYPGVLIPDMVGGGNIVPDGKVKLAASTPGTFKNGRNTPLSSINIIPL